MATRRGNSSGTEEQLPSGKWRARVRIAGRRFRVTAPTKQELRRWVREPARKEGVEVTSTEERPE